MFGGERIGPRPCGACAHQDPTRLRGGAGAAQTHLARRVVRLEHDAVVARAAERERAREPGDRAADDDEVEDCARGGGCGGRHDHVPRPARCGVDWIGRRSSGGAALRYRCAGGRKQAAGPGADALPLGSGQGWRRRAPRRGPVGSAFSRRQAA
jgi:hypothetical protein